MEIKYSSFKDLSDMDNLRQRVYTRFYKSLNACGHLSLESIVCSYHLYGGGCHHNLNFKVRRNMVVNEDFIICITKESFPSEFNAKKNISKHIKG